MQTTTRSSRIRIPTAPGQPRSWLHLLPAPYCDDPNVVVVMAPSSASLSMHTSLDEKIHLVTLKHRDNLVGLQVTEPKLSSWIEHSDVMMRLNVQIANPAHIGRISQIPQRLFMAAESLPLLFLRDQMSAPFLNLRHCVRNKTKREGQEAN